MQKSQHQWWREYQSLYYLPSLDGWK